MRLDNQTTSLHYFHVYAVQDRISFRHLSTHSTMITPEDINYNVFFPSEADNIHLLSNFEMLITRMFVKHIPGLQHLSREIQHHIEHQYSKNMALKSHVVPLGVLLKNENVLTEMVDILDALHKYVPGCTSTQSIDFDTHGGSIRSVDVQVQFFTHILIGGDQLTASRIRSAQRVLRNSESRNERLEGFIPVIEDWHTKMCFLEVIWKRLYSSCSVMDFGTLFQLRNVINRRNVVMDVSKDVAACEEFMELITTAHVLSAAIDISGVSSLEGLSSTILSTADQRTAMTTIARTLCSQFVNLVFTAELPKDKEVDAMLEYAKETLSLGLLLQEFKDAIREGDGSRVLRCWKYFLLLFRASQHKNYCIEALNFLMLYYYILPPRYAEQMLWGRFVNTEGGPGRNIPADLHMEHMNRLLKGTVNHLGANKTPQAIVRAGKALGVLRSVLEEFDHLTGRWTTRRHTTRSEANDLIKVVEELSQSKVFTHEPGREHNTFPSMKCNKLLQSIDQKKLHTWMKKKIADIIKLSQL